MDALLISACLLGSNCKYNGGNNALPEDVLHKLKARYRLVPTCPETAGGLPVPRQPSERAGERVVSRAGRDVTAEFEKGAEIAAELARRCGCKMALMKANSPSCGSGMIYDGTFTGTLTDGDGVAAEKLRALGVAVYSEKELDKLI